MDDETSPLLGNLFNEHAEDPHKQFCMLIGIPPSDLPKGSKRMPNAAGTLYERARATRKSQNFTYYFTASLSNTLLLSQVVLGAALTGLGASGSSHILITLFGAMNTIIAGLVTYLKSRGQPMRARMYRDDLEAVVDEIENSEIMWLGISKGIHGYNDIDIDQVSVRSEVARLTRLYDRAVKNNNMNNPDMYMTGGGAEPSSGLKAHTAAAQPPPASSPAAAPPDAASAAPAPAAVAAGADTADDSPATAPSKASDDKKDDAPKDSKPDQAQGPGSSLTSAAAPTPALILADPDASPATAPVPPKAQKPATDSNPSASDGGVNGKAGL